MLQAVLTTSRILSVVRMVLRILNRTRSHTSNHAKGNCQELNNNFLL